MPRPSKRSSDDAAPAHAKEPNPKPTHVEGADAPTHARAARRSWNPTEWLIPLVAVAVAAACILAIAVPAALVSGGSDPDPELSREVREAETVEPPIEDEDAVPPTETVDAEPPTEATDAQGVPERSEFSYRIDLPVRHQALAEASTALDQAVEAIQAQGYQVGYYVATTDGTEVVSLNPDTPIYGASSIKGPFVLRAFPEGVPGEYRGLVQDAIQWSDNDAYWLLREYLGYGVLADQLQEAGVEGFTSTRSFIWMTPRQLATIWVENLGALSLEGEPGDWLRGTFTETLNSRLGALAADDAFTVATAYSKAGWIETEDLSSTVDAGLVTLDGTDGEAGPSYVVAVMTDKGEDFEGLAGVVDALVDYLQVRSRLQ